MAGSLSSRCRCYLTRRPTSSVKNVTGSAARAKAAVARDGADAGVAERAGQDDRLWAGDLIQAFTVYTALPYRPLP